ncbi:hypothetical protein NDA13_000178 [Ustilago tritici]|nr:hypothetical protein NDA13_000178 [Ustilago tritici]
MVRTGTGRVVPWACDGTVQYQKRWRVEVSVEGKNRRAQTTFENLDSALELYDLAVLSQYGPGAKLNLPVNLSKYLGKLEQEAAKKQLEDFFEDRLRSPVPGKRKDRA